MKPKLLGEFEYDCARHRLVERETELILETIAYDAMGKEYWTRIHGGNSVPHLLQWIAALEKNK